MEGDGQGRKESIRCEKIGERSISRFSVAKRKRMEGCRGTMG
jgi:hypothetical protein